MCIEHFPNRLLATAQITLDYIEELKHGALALLVDVGHCLISRDDPDVSACVQEILEAEGVHVRCNSDCISVAPHPEGVAVKAE